VLRYHLLLEPWQLTNERLLDFGCGFGDMYAYCQTHLPGVQYEGFDLNPALVEIGRERYPGARFRSGHALGARADAGTDTAVAPGRDAVPDAIPDDGWDIIVASGVFNLKLEDSWAFVEETFELFSRHARKGFAANFLSDRVDFELDHTFHADPVKVLALAYRFSNRVVLRNDYMPFEFTIYVDLRRDFDPARVVYPEFMPWITAPHS
jgi:SAM-dependent methyltransferase